MFACANHCFLNYAMFLNMIMVNCIKTKECDFFLEPSKVRMQSGYRFWLRCAAILATVIVLCLLRGPPDFNNQNIWVLPILNLKLD